MEEDGGDKKRLESKEIDVRKLDSGERREFMQRNFKAVEEDNGHFLMKLSERFQRALPTLINSARNMVESSMSLLGLRSSRKATLTVLKDVSGILKSSRMALLLGPPSSGKTTLLRTLAARLDSSLKAAVEVTCNGYRLDEFVPQKTAAYIGQTDARTAELTLKETLDFSARCQGIGPAFEMLTELEKKEKDLGIQPEPEIDLFMKAIAMEGVESNLKTDYIIKVGVNYDIIGFSGEASRFFKQMFLIFFIQQTAAGLFRLIGGLCRLMMKLENGVYGAIGVHLSLMLKML
ncbi:putative P-loop containing nucleoside triphosphate hydrolase [Dioscorea sansibarensis]